MFSVIRMMNEIQLALSEAQLEHPIDLPRIAVIGAQSSGKSSVLESIVKEDFLPRGTGIVTRCPLILQLINNEEGDEKYATFSHKDGQVYKDFKEVTKEIELRTDELAGSEKKIVDKPIYLTICSPDVPNLTLIDLPGFTKLSTDDQDASICYEIESLVMKYIEQENTIILAISPANGDIANSDGLAYAKKVDPDRDRTFGVMTKIDIMDKGTDACDFLSGKLYKLKHGYIGVKCRSQADNNNGMSIQQALEEEKKFFASHPAYKKFADTQGTLMLAKKLSELLEKHIIKQLPYIQDLIKKNLRDYRKILRGIGKEVIWENEMSAVEYVIKVIEDFSQTYRDLIVHASSDSGGNSYIGGSRIYQIFKWFWCDKIDNIDPLKYLSEEDILIEMHKSYGVNPGLFIPEESWRKLITDYIYLFEKPIMECWKLVYQVLEVGIIDILKSKYSTRKKLSIFLQETMERLIKENYEALHDFLIDRIDAERWYVNYDDEDFVRLKQYITLDKEELSDYDINILRQHYLLDIDLFRVTNCYNKINNAIKMAEKKNKSNYRYGSNSQAESSRSSIKDLYPSWKIEEKVDISKGISKHDRSNVIQVKRVIHCYFSILKKNMKTNIPKFIIKFLVRKTTKEINYQLQMALRKEKDALMLVSENDDIKKTREIAVNSTSKLERAIWAIKQVARDHQNILTDDMFDEFD